MKRLLDLYCCAGGSSRGYQRAGFHVTGVDKDPQPRHCGDEFIQADALEYLEAHGHEYDAIHASPPCQGYSIMRNLPWLKDREYPLLIKPTRDLLIRVGKPWVLENVMGAKWGCKNLVNISEQLGYDITDHGMKAGYLCGGMFGLPFRRHRLFETLFYWLSLEHPNHTTRSILMPVGNSRTPGQRTTFTDSSGRVRTNDSKLSLPTKESGLQGSLAQWQGNGAQKNGVGIGHAAGWKLAAKAMGIDWMRREELTQALPPIYTEYIGTQLMSYLNET